MVEIEAWRSRFDNDIFPVVMAQAPAEKRGHGVTVHRPFLDRVKEYIDNGFSICTPDETCIVGGVELYYAGCEY